MVNSKSKKILSLMLTLLMVIGMISMGIVSASATSRPAVNYTLVLSGANGYKGSVSETNKLTQSQLSAFGIAASEPETGVYEYTFAGASFSTRTATAIKILNDSTIKLEGENTVKSGDKGDDNTYGIYTDNNLIIKGDGKLTVYAGNTTFEGGFSYGIFSNKAVVINGGNIICNAGNTCFASYGIKCKDFIMTNGNAAFNSGNSSNTGTAVGCYGIGYNGSFLMSGGSLNAVSGNAVTNNAQADSFGIFADFHVTTSFTVTGGTIIASSGTASGRLLDATSTAFYTINKPVAKVVDPDDGTVLTYDVSSSCYKKGADIATKAKLTLVPHYHNEGTADEMVFDRLLPTSGELATGNYYIKGNTTLAGKLTVASGATVNICLNGYVLDLNGNNITSIGTSTAKKTLNVYGGDKTNSYILKKNETSGRYEIVAAVNDDTITVKGGTVINGNAIDYNGGAFFLNHTNGKIFDVTFVGNKTTDVNGYNWECGGCLYIGVSDYYITNCEFYDNCSHYGGAINANVFRSNVVLKNCIIKNNKSYACGHAIIDWGKLTVIDCDISENYISGTVTDSNCDIECGANGQLIVGGTTKIGAVYDGNTAGGILVDTDTPLAEGASIGACRWGITGDISGDLDADYSKYFTLLNNAEGTYRLADIEKTVESATKHVLTVGTAYDVTVDDSTENGTVEVNTSKAIAGEKVTITATPESTDYEVKSYSVTYTDTTVKSVNVTDDGTFTMPAFDVTVSAAFGKTDAKLLEEYKADKLLDLDDLGDDMNDIIKDAKDVIDAVVIGQSYATLNEAKAAVDEVVSIATTGLNEARENAFDAYKAEKLEALNDVEDEYKSLVEDAIVEITAMEYDGSKTLEENKQSVEAAFDTAMNTIKQQQSSEDECEYDIIWHKIIIMILKFVFEMLFKMM